MISSPQGDLKHTGHVGLDGAYFGDVSFLGDKVRDQVLKMSLPVFIFVILKLNLVPPVTEASRGPIQTTR